jgi:hypothetical protein
MVSALEAAAIGPARAGADGRIRFPEDQFRSALGSRSVSRPDDVVRSVVVVVVVLELDGMFDVSVDGAVLLAGWLVSAVAGAGWVVVSGVDCA